MNEAMLSYTVKVIDPQGFDEMFTIRGDDPADYFNKISSLKNWLKQNGYTPTGQRRANNGNGAQAPQDAAPICNLHNRPMKPSKFGGFYCPAKLAAGDYCKEKVGGQPPAPQPMTQAQAVQHAANGTPPPPAMFDSTPPPDSYYNES